MFVTINRKEGKYEAVLEVASNDVFKSIEPLEKERLNEVLLELGFHQRDIFDAFAVADGEAVNRNHPLFEAKRGSE